MGRYVLSDISDKQSHSLHGLCTGNHNGLPSLLMGPTLRPLALADSASVLERADERLDGSALLEVSVMTKEEVMFL